VVFHRLIDLFPGIEQGAEAVVKEREW